MSTNPNTIKGLGQTGQVASYAEFEQLVFTFEAGLDKPLGGGLQIRIGRHGLFFEPVQDRIVIQLPPIRTQFAIQRLRFNEGTRPMP